MEKRKVGRPTNEPTDLITYDQAVEEIILELRRKYKNEEIVKKCALTKRTLQNKVYLGELRSWRKGRIAVVSQAEALKLVG